jgi:hypothetical protein
LIDRPPEVRKRTPVLSIAHIQPPENTIDTPGEWSGAAAAPQQLLARLYCVIYLVFMRISDDVD